VSERAGGKAKIVEERSRGVGGVSGSVAALRE